MLLIHLFRKELLEISSCVYSDIMFTIISSFQKLIKGVGISVEGLENFSKINRWGMIIRYSREGIVGSLKVD